MNKDTSNDNGLAEFTEYFVRNYPGPTTISDPNWHAPKLFRAATRQLERELSEANARIEVLEGALRPFAALLQSHHDGMRPEQPIFGINSVTITKQHLINARTALEGKS